ncbi:MAG: hypothetical protein K2K19_06490, partial [Acetatifactor sp.]|nr:hypothetical protein [Acetatifactor sp.]
MSLFVMGLAVLSLPAALIAVDSGKERILISEEVLSGNPAEAAGVTLKIPSHWEKQLLWDTEYTIGSGNEAESRFSFSSQPVYWSAPEEKVDASLRIEMDAAFATAALGTGYATSSGTMVWEDTVYSEMINEAAGRAHRGEKYTEIIRIADYSPSFPLSLEIEGHSVRYEGNYQEARNYLRDFFHISAAEDQMEVTVELKEQGNISTAAVYFIENDEQVSIVNAAADDGGEGLYFTYCLENAQTGEWADRGQNMGIFYFPYWVQEPFLHIDLTQVKWLCDYPGNAIPLQMLVDSEKGILYLAVREREDYRLLVYQLVGKIPVLMQQVPVNLDNPSAISPSCFCQMLLVDGGVLMTWEDNRFAFIARENGQYRLWCSGVFPEDVEKDSNNPFPKEQVCLFDGKKLILTAYENWYSTNVLLSVYDDQGQTY